MFAVGHFALGYLTGKITANYLKVTINLPLLFFVSVFPDVDLLMPLWLQHRGPTHSIIFLSLIFIPFIIIYKKTALVYFVAALQHTLIGDFLAGGAQILWPLSTNYFGIHIDPHAFVISVLELTFFLVSLIVMFKTKDVLTLFKYSPASILFSLLNIAVLLPGITGPYFNAPLLLIVPYIIYLLLFSIPIITGLKATLKKLKTTKKT